VAQNPVHEGLLEVNMAALNALARNKRAEDLGVAGVKGVRSVSVTSRA
jgi:hypothetical protein